MSDKEVPYGLQEDETLLFDRREHLKLIERSKELRRKIEAEKEEKSKEPALPKAA